MDMMEFYSLPYEDRERIIAAELDSPEYFRCKRTLTWMKKEHCIERQTRSMWDFTQGFGAKVVPVECENCPQGKELAKSFSRN